MQLDDIRFSPQQLSDALSNVVAAANIAFDVSQVSNITLDSRRANLHTAFVALKGSVQDAYQFIENTIGQHCKLIFCEKQPTPSVQALAKKAHANVIVVEQLREKLPHLLSALYLHHTNTSEHDLKMMAVTGTNGKTSVAAIYAQLSLAAHARSASLGTIGLQVYAHAHESEQERVHTDLLNNIDVGSNTTPDIITHYKVVALLRQQKINAYCLEASSHGIEQGRLRGLPIQTAVFTNLTQDHLDYHGNMQAYGEAKRGLLSVSNVKHVVLNAHDEQSVLWQKEAKQLGGANIVWFALDKTALPEQCEHYLYADSIQSNESGFTFKLHTSWGNSELSLALLGRFNILNFLAALGAHLIEGANFEALLSQSFKVKGVPGRMELFRHRPIDSTMPNTRHGNIIVDYAHTPDALEQALKSAREHTRGKLHCVFGCGGNRDKSKRALMGEAAAKYSDAITLTQDNSRDEAPEDIIADIQRGISSKMAVNVVLDRKQAVRDTWQASENKDLVLLAGKGHEDYLEINQQRLPYSERDFVKQLFAEASA